MLISCLSGALTFLLADLRPGGAGVGFTVELGDTESGSAEEQAPFSGETESPLSQHSLWPSGCEVESAIGIPSGTFIQAKT